MILIWFALIPLAGALISLALEKIKEEAAGAIALISTAATFILSLYAPHLTLAARHIVYRTGGWEIPLGITLILDGFGAFILVIINLVFFVVTIYSISYIRKRYTASARFFVLFLFCAAGLNGVALSGDIFNFYVFVEMVALSSYSLVAFGAEREDLEASIRYQMLGTLGSFFILLGIGFLYSVTGTLDFGDMSRVIKQTGITLPVMFSVPLLLFGFALKVALVPFHAWLPDAYPTAPAPVTAVLAGVVSKVVGIYGIVRIFFGVIGMNFVMYQILLYAGIISIFFGAFAALAQTDFKRLLAYSSISQIGYVMLGLGIGTPVGIAGALFHALNHATFKSLYFLSAGAVEESAGTRNLDELGGLSEKMPVTTFSSLFASFSLAGVPPFGGFWSKALIIFACILAGKNLIAVLVALASVLTLAYFLKIQRKAFFSKLPEGLVNIKESPVLMCVAMVIMALVCLGLGLGVDYVMDILIKPAANSLLIGTGYGNL
ncbi:MAG: proton-conducting transporter membrane subunit [Elusimicrobiota bacterium]